MSTATAAPTAKAPLDVLKPQEPPRTVDLINREAVKQLAAYYGRHTTLPRVPGHSSDLSDASGNPVLVGRLMVVEQMLIEAEMYLTAAFEDAFRNAAMNIAQNSHPDSAGEVDEKWRVVPPFRGPLRVERIDTLKGSGPR